MSSTFNKEAEATAIGYLEQVWSDTKIDYSKIKIAASTLYYNGFSAKDVFKFIEENFDQAVHGLPFEEVKKEIADIVSQIAGSAIMVW